MFEDLKKARLHYDTLLGYDDLHSVSLCAVIESTDYETHPTLKGLDRTTVHGVSIDKDEETYRSHEVDVFDRLSRESYIGTMSSVEAWDWVDKNRSLIRKCSDEQLNPFDTIDWVVEYNENHD